MEADVLWEVNPILAMILEEMPHHKPYRIWATDIDEDALDKAKEGVYSEDFICSVPPLYLEKYFQPLGEGKYADVPSLKRRIVFEKHDLLQDEVKETFALVVCRNVVIYFEDEAKRMAFEKMSNALQEGGYLWIGSTERIADLLFRIALCFAFFTRKVGECMWEFL